MNIKSSAINYVCVSRANNATPRSVFLNFVRIMQSMESMVTSLRSKPARAEGKLVKAIKDNDDSYLNKELGKRPELAEKLVKERGCKGKLSPLSLASYYGQLDAMSELLDAFVDINKADTEGTTALMFAVKSGSIGAVKLLLQHKPNINQADKMGFSALMIAVKLGSLDIVRLLLDHGADLNQQNKQGISCSAVAAAQGKLELVKELIEHGLDIFNEDDERKNILMVACEHGHLDIVRFLKAQGVNLNQQAMITKTTALHFAVKHGHEEVVEFLLEEGADPNLTDISDHGPLYLAKQNKDSQIMNMLVAHKAEDDSEEMSNESSTADKLLRFFNRRSPSYKSFS